MAQNNISPERTMLVCAALEGMIAAKVQGSWDSGSIPYYSKHAVRIADATLLEMAIQVVPVPPLQPEIEVIVEQEVIIK